MPVEGILKNRWLRLFAVILAVTVLRVMVQPLMPTGDNGVVTEPSVFVKAGLLVPMFVLYAFMLFLATSITFLLIERALTGSGLRKGATFGMAYGLLWFLYFLEPLTAGPAPPLVVTLAYPVVDGTTFLFLGLLLGRFVGSDASEAKSPTVKPRLLALLAIPLALVVIRYCTYSVHGIFSAFDARPIDTMLWVAGTGVWLGAMYYVLRPGIPGIAPWQKAVFFGLGAVGVNLLLFNLLIPLVFEANVADMVLRTVIDTIAVTVGVYAYEKLGAIAQK